MQLEIITAKEFAPVLERLAQLEKDNAMLKEIVEQNAELIDSAEAGRLTGFSDNRTLKKHFTPIPTTSGLRFSKAEIIRWKHDQSLHKAPELRISA